MEGQSSKALVWDAGTSKKKDEEEKMFVQGWNSWKELGVKGKDLAVSEHSHWKVTHVPCTWPCYKHAPFIYRHSTEVLVLTSTEAIKPKLPRGSLKCILPCSCSLQVCSCFGLWLEVLEIKERGKVLVRSMGQKGDSKTWANPITNSHNLPQVCFAANDWMQLIFYHPWY